jgi:hypothetical protein
MSDAKLSFWQGRQKNITERPVSEDERAYFLTEENDLKFVE